MDQAKPASWKLLVAALLAVLLSAGVVAAQSIEYDTDRLGGDFDRVTLHVSDPRACQAICMGTEQCVAWTYTPAGFNGYETPQCWLKDQQTPGYERKDAASGIIPERFAAAESSDLAPERTETGAAAWAECSNPDNWLQPDLDLSQFCMVEKAVDQMDPSICSAIADLAERSNCYGSAGLHVMDKCATLEEEQKRLSCQMLVAVEFPNPKSCIAAPDDFKLMCHMTVAEQTGDSSTFLREVRYLSSEDRDFWIGALATATTNFDLLELIEDNSIYDKTLTSVATGRIARGLFVEPGVCSMLAGGYGQTSVDGDLSAAQYRDLCVQGVAFARVMRDWAQDKDIEEILALQNAMEEYFHTHLDASDYADFPMGLGDEMRRETALAHGEMQAATATQSGAMTPEAQTNGTPSAFPNLPAGDGVATTSTCIFGVCSE